MKHLLLYCAVSATIIFSSFNVAAQSADSTKKKFQYRNNIKFNLTSNITYSPSAIFSYERTIKQFQTVNVKAGYGTLPQPAKGVLSDSSFRLESTFKQSGYVIGGDYRFYFKKENKYNAPHGLYWGPFIDYFSFMNKRELTVVDTTFAKGTIGLTTDFKFLQAGVNIGYQFVLWKRLSIDMNLFGPALAYYNADLKLNGNYDPTQEDKYLQALYEYVIGNLPVLGELITTGELNSSGRADFFYAGFRYSVSAGFRF